MYRSVARSFPNVHTGKFSRVLWTTERGDSVESSFTFVTIDTRSTRASAMSTFVDGQYFRKNTNHFDLHSNPRTDENNQNFPVKNPMQIYKTFEGIRLVCQRDSSNHFNPSAMFMYQKNVIKYNRTTEYIPELSANTDDNLNNVSRFGNRQIENNTLNLLAKHVIPRNDSVPFYRKIAEIKEYYDRCRTATNTPDTADDPSTITRTDKKYWSQRFKYFEKFNNGVLLDKESFYSVCPELLAHHIAKRCRNLVAIDPFCGAGGNVIQLAMTCKKVIAMDMDPDKVRMARINAKIYGVSHKIEFHVGDFFQLTGAEFQADVLVTSPPWGGPGYSAARAYSLESLCRAQGGGARIMEIAKRIAPNVALHLPKTTNVPELISLAKDWGKVEIQQNVIDERINSITAFYGAFETISNCPWPPYL